MDSSGRRYDEGRESESLLPQHAGNRRSGADRGHGDHGLETCTTATGPPRWPGVLDLLTVFVLAWIGWRAHKHDPVQREIVDLKDPSLSYKYHSHVRYPDRPWLPIISLLAPVTVLVVVRLLHAHWLALLQMPWFRRIDRWVRMSNVEDSHGLVRSGQQGDRIDLRSLLVEAGKWVYIDGFAVLAAASLTYAVVETLKVWCGGLRPDFLSRCDWDSKEGQCTGSEWLVNAGRKSFPSGHATYSFSAMTLVTKILFVILDPIRTSFFSTVICMLPLVWAGRVSATRWWENRHSSLDLFAGMLTGIALALLSFRIFYASRVKPSGCSY